MSRKQLIEAEVFNIESTHHFHGDTCLCGFSSARSRSRTEHITGLALAAFEEAHAVGSFVPVASDVQETAHAPTDDEREALIEQATWALIEYDTDTADRGVGDEHYRERRADVERVFPILFRRTVQGEPRTPDGWFPFGSHAPYPWVGRLEFSDEKDEAGMPLWERPVQGEPFERPSFDAFGEPRNRAAQELQAQGDLSDDEREALLKELAAWRRHTGDTALANLLGRAASALAAMTAAKEIAWADEVAANRRTVQREPSEAAVKAAMDEYLRAETGGKVRAMRAALRAAAEVEGGGL